MDRILVAGEARSRSVKLEAVRALVLERVLGARPRSVDDKLEGRGHARILESIL
jgi:hypothetical protein